MQFDEEMDIIAQLQEHASKIAYIAFNAAGTIQRDAPPSQLFQDYPRPPAASADALTTVVEQPKEMAAAFVDAVKQVSSSSCNFLSRSLVSSSNVHSFFHLQNASDWGRRAYYGYVQEVWSFLMCNKSRLKTKSISKSHTNAKP